MKNSLDSAHWSLSDDMLSANFYTEEHEADLSAETFSWEVDPMTLLEDLEEGWDEDDDLNGMY